MITDEELKELMPLPLMTFGATEEDIKSLSEIDWDGENDVQQTC